MEIEPVFEVKEIDLNYEFDAARFFDFTREELPAEAGEAELWFESAPSYPPSPFATKLVMREESLLESVTTSPKCDEEDTSTLHESDPENAMALKFSATGAINKGLTIYNHLPGDKLKAKSKSAKPLQRNSTLMKPTASQLAKQNRPPQSAASRFQKLPALNSNRSLGNSSAVESQAAKRQKLEGGLLRKVDEVKQQTTLVHKAPKKEGTRDRNTINTKLRLTIPREPELETAHRAQRIRPKNGTEEELVTSVTHRFKARPLNRKVGTYDVTKGTSSKADFIVLLSSQIYVHYLQILEGPSLPVPKKSVPKLPEFQEFHLKTLERAVQLSSAVSSSIHTNAADKGLEKPCTISATGNGTREAGRQGVMDTISQDVCDTKYNFKARPLNRKIFSSKGDIGVFRNIKRETTVPMEFNFQTEKRVPQNPPIELFSKLSLTSELQPSNGSQMKFPRPTFISTKGSKENRFTSFQPEYEASKKGSTRVVQIRLPTRHGYLKWILSFLVDGEPAAPFPLIKKRIDCRSPYLISDFVPCWNTVAYVQGPGGIVPSSLATEFTVGDEKGWHLDFDYQGWATGKEFRVGDKLVFKYTPGVHDVLKVNGTEFQQCQAGNDNTLALTTGNDVITLSTPGRKWYICSVPGHCEARNMKLSITVLDQVGSPATAPTSQSAAIPNAAFSFYGWIAVMVSFIGLVFV
ncbi:hypothetical protein V6N13_077012 [Hibiscus sabdariffa]